ncbi:Rha family transcriptional regulator [Campylobacter coli]
MSNTSIININNQEVIFENKDEQVFCTSLDVAKVFGKQHKHILELIGEKFNNNEIKNFCEPNFRLSFKTRKIEGFRGRERKYPYYQLTKDGFSFIAMGLTGRKADKFKIYNKYKIPNTPYKENIIKAIMQTEQNRNCEFEELIAYEIKEIYKDNKSHIEQKINFKVKGLI